MVETDCRLVPRLVMDSLSPALPRCAKVDPLTLATLSSHAPRATSWPHVQVVTREGVAAKAKLSQWSANGVGWVLQKLAGLLCSPSPQVRQESLEKRFQISPSRTRPSPLIAPVGFPSLDKENPPYADYRVEAPNDVFVGHTQHEVPRSLSSSALTILAVSDVSFALKQTCRPGEQFCISLKYHLSLPYPKEALSCTPRPYSPSSFRRSAHWS